ncbi:MAG: sulfatase-like hydrolase/transferase [bacterium]|nr:sulfatase-like hydrolase/transferase [bacterium]
MSQSTNQESASGAPDQASGLSRRNFIRTAAAVSAGLLGGLAPGAPAGAPAAAKESTVKQEIHPQAAGGKPAGKSPSRRPNIVFIMADQLGARFLGCYGSGVDSTPTLDGLAAEGLRFDRFYATAPVCAPNRATILTGRSPEIHGVVTNNVALQSDNPTYAHELRGQGYRTGVFGKIHQTPMHWAPPSSLDFLGFDEAIISEDPRWSPYIDWVKANHPEHYAAALATTNSHSGSVQAYTPMDAQQGATPEQQRLKREAFERLLAPRKAASAWDRMYVSPVP